MIKEAIKELSQGSNLTADEMTEVMEEIMTGEALDVHKAAFLTALAMKGETIDEITAAANVMKKHCKPFHSEKGLLEIVGTGGDGSNTFNISTLSAIVCAAAGQKVAKHGNRAASSKCGTADCFEALGAKIDLETEDAENVLDEAGLIFLFAQKYHPAMRFVGGVRKEIGIRTIFNILGPLTNPASADIQLMGVYSEKLVEPLVRVLHNIGVERAMAVYGTDCIDEISMSAPTVIAEYIDGNYRKYTICPEDFGFKTCQKSELVGGEPKENAQIAINILKGESGPKTDTVLLNSGVALYLAGKADSIEEGINLAKETIESGKALKKLEQFIELTNNDQKIA
ncbi:MAG: anthranilate phosphoribosyltransferase [Lachnospiraceae bacterium]|nr:anthranilate phosphoribosyltransferase [Lachnospiraceae bacterium]